jgi:hypothetical protein
MAARSARSSHSIASARRRNIAMFGQLGLAAMKAWKRAKSAPLSALWRIAHSTSLRAVGSAIRCCASVASFGRRRLAKPIASRTAARSEAEAVMAGAAMGLS